VGLGHVADERDGLGVRPVRRPAGGADVAPPGDVVPAAVRGHPRLHGVPRGHHERRVGDRHDDQRDPDVEAGTEALSPAMPAAPLRGAPGTRRTPALALPTRKPPRPGEFLESRYLKPLAISQTELARALG